MTNQKLYEIALTLLPGIGYVNGKKLVAYCGGAEAVFREKKKALMQINGVRCGTRHLASRGTGFAQ